ncbi:hypothetical protein QVD17_13100 [Tagetes erecta]|uniref:Leucine-rich repeat-containing N-terminal plant-type domain-containing protein n=1 Tax=Tagetes erecta TaxID=13708 RepID=A0AAD8P398_TARER|nr:hypothetical protein QVD17_13100 [Tagetes erecta]
MTLCNFFRHLLPLILTLFTSISPSTQQLFSGDLNALHQITYSLTDVKKTGGFFSTWNFTSPEIQNPCVSFSGVTCSVVNNQLRVVSLYLGTGLSDSPGLAGIISAEGLYQLTELTQLVIYPGIVTGFIPSEIGNRLKNLRIIFITNNRITGTIPVSISKLSHLHTLDLSHNKLTGKIPATLTTLLPNLKTLVLSYNRLVGEVPNFSDESQLIHLDLKNNLLDGALPKNFPKTLRYLSLSSNGLWGPVDSVTSSFNLVYLDLSMNKFTGSIPSSLFFTSLQSMYLQRNNFTGKINSPFLSTSTSTSTSSFELYGFGSTIDLSHNLLSGEIPSFLDSVETLFLNNNHFTGKVPESYVSNVFAGKMKTLYLQRNYITLFPMGEKMGTVLPDGVALCLRYNCMVPPAVGLTACPVSAGGPVSRPFGQCSVFNSGKLMG